MAHTKQSVDATAEAYWESYFGAYGKAFTKKVPRKVAAAIAAALAKVATAGAEKPPTITRARIAPLGYAATATGGLTFEGVFRGTSLKDGKPSYVFRAFAADFDANGELTHLQQIAA
jgi:hypothetical protein